ncbi:42428_t:CDS:2 [Gigaspora margarita]|uniref:42428_t:CDS:1 n=1 Tax=Gigaspora margarita TaxID=4874 RepID=A0ABM8VWX0_GIGMA|nr:42428_t:CDS:2 [Gigaspora margarita]
MRILKSIKHIRKHIDTFEGCNKKVAIGRLFIFNRMVAMGIRNGIHNRIHNGIRNGIRRWESKENQKKSIESLIKRKKERGIPKRGIVVVHLII